MVSYRSNKTTGSSLIGAQWQISFLYNSYAPINATTPMWAAQGDWYGDFVFLYQDSSRGGRGFVISTLRYWACVCACIHTMCSFHQPARWMPSTTNFVWQSQLELLCSVVAKRNFFVRITLPTEYEATK